MAVFTGITSTLVSWGLTAAAASAVTQVGVGLALTAVSRAITGDNQSLPRREVQAVVSQADAPRKRAYGKNRLGGVRAFFEAKDGILSSVIIYHQGPVHRLLNWVVDGEVAEENGGGNLEIGSVDLDERIYADWRNGTTANYSRLRNDYSMWTSDHELRGLVTAFTRFRKPKPEDFSKIFPRAAQTSIQMDVEAVEVLDTRDGVTRYSDNPALCIRDYMVAADGMRVPAAAMDDAQWGVFASICDEAVPRKGGGTQKRYRLAGAYSLEDKPATVLSEMLATCDGGIYLTTEGKLAPHGGKYSEPDVTITEDDILEIEWGTGRNPMTAFNVLKGMYFSSDHDFTDTEAPELRDEMLLATQGERTDTLDVPWCPDGHQMQRLMKSHMYRAQPPRTATITTNLVGIKARFPKGDGVHAIRIEAGALSGVYEVLDHAYSIADGTCTIAVHSLEDVWAWGEDEEQDLAPALPDDPAVVAGGAFPQGLTLAVETIQIDQAGTRGAQIVAQVDDPDREDLVLRAEYSLAGSNDWRAMSVASGARKALSGVLAEGDYSVRVWWAGQGVATVDYPNTAITLLSNPTSPPAPTEFSTTLIDNTVTISWRNPGSDYYRTRVYRSATNVFGDSVQVSVREGVSGEIGTHEDQPGVGTWHYWVDVQNPSLVPSNEVGPISVTLS